jgi:hypothetical protein
MPNSGSMAVWCEPRVPAQNATGEIHFNYWRLTRQSKFKGKPGYPPSDFAEVGVLLRQPMLVDRIQIFLPLRLARADVSDCGPYFAQVEIAQGIFNEPLTSRSVGPPGPRRVELQKDEVPFCHVHKFLVNEAGVIAEGQLSLTSQAEGTLLTILRDPIDEICEALPENCPAYFRLRSYLSPSDRNPFIASSLPPIAASKAVSTKSSTSISVSTRPARSRCN